MGLFGANNKKNAKKGQKKKKVPKGVVGAGFSKYPSGLRFDPEGRVVDHAAMVADPCGAKLGKSAYRGRDGIVTRHKKIDSFTSDNTAFLYVYYPAYNGIWTVSVADAETALPTPNWTTPGPGQAFLLNTAASQRCVGACVTYKYYGTELNRSGVIYTGNIPVSTLNGTNTIKDICALLQNTEKMPDGGEQKWIPTAIEEEYWLTGPTAPDNYADRNAIIVVGYGISNGIRMEITTTGIYEWLPDIGMGIAEPVSNNSEAVGGFEQLRILLSKLPGFEVMMGGGVLAKLAAEAAKVYGPSVAKRILG